MKLSRTIAGLLALQAALVFAFVFPGYKPEAHHVPVGIVAPEATADAFAAKGGDRLDVKRYATETAARTAIEDRDVYGALIADGAEPHLLVASAASNSVAQMLRGAAAKAAPSAEVRDIVPLDPDDPRGSTINLLFLPLVMVSFTAVLALGALGLSRRRLVEAVALFSILGGFAVAAILAFGLGSLPGSYLALSGVTGLIVLSVALPTAGLHRLLGQPGIVLAALSFLVVGNPASGNGSAPELLPGVWRWIGQLMPPGAGGTSLRNTSYFDGAALATPMLVLAGYAVLGASLVAAAGRRRRQAADTGPRRVAEALERQREAA